MNATINIIPKSNKMMYNEAQKKIKKIKKIMIKILDLKLLNMIEY